VYRQSDRVVSFQRQFPADPLERVWSVSISRQPSVLAIARRERQRATGWSSVDACKRQGEAVGTLALPSSSTTFALVMVAVMAAGCSPKPASTPVYDPLTRALTRIDYDYDADGRIDVRTYMKNGRPERLEGDADGDGKTDRWEYYDAHGALQRVGGSTAHDGVEDTWAHQIGDETRVDYSTHRDGIVDRREFYRGELLLRTERDTNGDAVMDAWEQYENGRLAMLWLDDDKRRGRATRRLVYTAGGAARVEIDPDGDGRFTPQEPD
jgi:hypothetical protein